ncbi:hypothetical protein FKP32DRAFT_84943 [Trametes sanguinea]|nr:hypothetical protein FKP32DRAFT_84943 [Trametes sanguinea]
MARWLFSVSSSSVRRSVASIVPGATPVVRNNAQISSSASTPSGALAHPPASSSGTTTGVVVSPGMRPGLTQVFKRGKPKIVGRESVECIRALASGTGRQEVKQLLKHCGEGRHRAGLVVRIEYALDHYMLNMGTHITHIAGFRCAEFSPRTHPDEKAVLVVPSQNLYHTYQFLFQALDEDCHAHVSAPRRQPSKCARSPPSLHGYMHQRVQQRVRRTRCLSSGHHMHSSFDAPLVSALSDQK